MLERLIPFKGVAVKSSAKATGYDGKILTINVNGKTETLECDSVVLAVGYSENKDLYKELEFEIPELYLLGDAKEGVKHNVWNMGCI